LKHFKNNFFFGHTSKSHVFACQSFNGAARVQQAHGGENFKPWMAITLLGFGRMLQNETETAPDTAGRADSSTFYVCADIY
jgi:hypothetical protein